jgi:hypothetical protein
MMMAEQQMQLKQQEQAQLQQMMQGTALDMAGVQVSE